LSLVNYYDSTVEFAGERVLKIGQHLMKLWTSPTIFLSIGNRHMIGLSINRSLNSLQHSQSLYMATKKYWKKNTSVT